VFGRAKVMVNGNHFQFNRKISFNFWKTIYSFQKRFENRKSFSEFKLIILARTFVEIHHRRRRALEFVGNPTPPPKIPKF
jgi:hypothetical protein